MCRNLAMEFWVPLHYVYPMGRCSHCKINWAHWRWALGDRSGTNYTLWVFIAFFGSLLLAMHPAGRVKTSALLTGDI